MAEGREDTEIFWIEPRERAILPLDGFHCSHSLAKVLRQERFQVTCNAAFTDVIAACAAPRPDHPESWISGRITASYRALHAEGRAHSIECWQDGQLVGGLYGVGFDRVFCGESMFSRVPDASKVALAWLVATMRAAHATLLDCQFMTGHLASMGAIEIKQKTYLDLLQEAQRATIPAALDLPGGYASLLASALASASAGGASSPGKFIAQSLTQTS